MNGAEGGGSGAWLLYGANGFTGRLIAEEAASRGERPVLAGRRAEAVREVAEPLGLEWRAFPLDDPPALRRGIEGARAVLLAAGPFAFTSRPVVEGCLAAGIHYLDVTGEISAFEAVFARYAEASDRGVALLPGCGFGVVPTDCLAASLAARLPGAARLELAFGADRASPSRGTVRTMIQGLARGGAVREAGRIRRVPIAWRTRVVPFRDRPRLAVTVPWGDVATAWWSTGIPDIVVWMAVSTRVARLARGLRLVARGLGIPPVRRAAGALAAHAARGPDAVARHEGRAHVWGRAEHSGGTAVEGWGETPEGYRFTAVASVESVRRLLAAPRAGALTPSLAFGAGFLNELPGCSIDVGPLEGA